MNSLLVSVTLFAMPTLFYIHDPMCSWCWGFRRTWDQLRLLLPDCIEVVNVVGGLAADTDAPMPLEQQKLIAGYWKDVATATGAEFNFDFWQKCEPRRSTYPACRAVLVARRSGLEDEMIGAIQRAYYLRAMNPSNQQTLVFLARELGMDEMQFAKDLQSQQIQDELHTEFDLRRRLGVRSFPSLVLTTDELTHSIPVNYQDSEPTLNMINSALAKATTERTVNETS